MRALTLLAAAAASSVHASDPAAPRGAAGEVAYDGLAHACLGFGAGRPAPVAALALHCLQGPAGPEANITEMAPFATLLQGVGSPVHIIAAPGADVEACRAAFPGFQQLLPALEEEALGVLAHPDASGTSPAAGGSACEQDSIVSPRAYARLLADATSAGAAEPAGLLASFRPRRGCPGVSSSFGAGFLTAANLGFAAAAGVPVAYRPAAGHPDPGGWCDTLLHRVTLAGSGGGPFGAGWGWASSPDLFFLTLYNRLLGGLSGSGAAGGAFAGVTAATAVAAGEPAACAAPPPRGALPHNPLPAAPASFMVTRFAAAPGSGSGRVVYMYYNVLDQAAEAHVEVTDEALTAAAAAAATAVPSRGYHFTTSTDAWEDFQEEVRKWRAVPAADAAAGSADAPGDGPAPRRAIAICRRRLRAYGPELAGGDGWPASGLQGVAAFATSGAFVNGVAAAVAPEAGAVPAALVEALAGDGHALPLPLQAADGAAPARLSLLLPPHAYGFYVVG